MNECCTASSTHRLMDRPQRGMGKFCKMQCSTHLDKAVIKQDHSEVEQCFVETKEECDYSLFMFLIVVCQSVYLLIINKYHHHHHHLVNRCPSRQQLALENPFRCWVSFDHGDPCICGFCCIYFSSTNVVMSYTEVEAKVREATNDDAWGPTGVLMQEISQYTFTYEHFPEVMGMLWKRMLTENRKNWRRVYKVCIFG